MAVNFHKTQTFLPSQPLTYADVLRKNKNINQYEAGSPATSTEFTSSWSSSTSGLSTPAGTDFSSTESETDNDGLISELTRQMADYMLREDDKDETSNTVSQNSMTNGWSGKWSDSNSGSSYHHGHTLTGTSVNPTCTGFYFNQAFADDQRPHREVYQVKNQQKYQGSEYWERRGKITESTQKVKAEQAPDKEHHKHKQKKGRRREFSHGGRVHPLGSSQHGSGMRVIFLGGSGSKTWSGGTGVFLPRGDDNVTETRKKPGCSTVLIPAKVLQALDLHFNNINDLSRSNGCGAYSSRHDDSGVMDTEDGLSSRILPTLNHEELHLPQDWTY